MRTENSEPCNECEMCKSIQSSQLIDIIEIDGASNRGIDEIRTLRDSVKYAPTRGKYKVYIIDEVHMLTKESFNAFLKTLENHRNMSSLSLQLQMFIKFHLQLFRDARDTISEESSSIK